MSFFSSIFTFHINHKVVKTVTMVGEKYDMHLADCGEWVIGRPNIFNIQVLIACFYLSMNMSMSMINFKVTCVWILSSVEIYI